jgi:Tfp pilus assembly protein PilF
MKSLHLLIMLALLGTATGCASYTPVFSGDNDADQSYSASQVSQNTAVQNLYDQAMNYLSVGDFDQAEATLERGLRIEPNNPYLWFELARLSADYGNVKKARELASRAQSLAGGDRYLQGQIERFANGL